ncbi:MAG: bifunctional glutamate N-acetyltransferase/amino-acid acetyltransferase ArgJ [Aestuariivita sp.]|nr:bifunctional glutamate N-acetyltransferase/amino-acid acetyltransferase ArgJ [Aestuariivita sp.]
MTKHLKKSPLAPRQFPVMPIIKGALFSTTTANIKYIGRPDVFLATFCPNTSIAGVFSQSATRAAPVLDCQSKIDIQSSSGAAILVNSGNANAFTGKRGQQSVKKLCAAVAKRAKIPENRVFTSSTGVIGEPLPHDRILTKINTLIKQQKPSNLYDAANAIMTTDTFPKGAANSILVNDCQISLAGIAKGSGMIAPDMATMLAYIFTDAFVPQKKLQKIVNRLNRKTFNCITVDSDTSTSDTVLVFATGTTGVDVSNNSAFESALNSVMLSLAQQIVRDGEGATKFIEIRVCGAKSDLEARVHAFSIANSPLVKTAIAGEDPNWGRIVMAIGKSGAQADRDLLRIWFGDFLIAENGWIAPNYQEEDIARYMKNQELKLSVNLGLGNGDATVWTCDLTSGYIKINSDYRS